MVSDGRVLYAWDRPLRPSADPVDQIRTTLLPGETGWDQLAASATARPYDIGSYLTIWPNAMFNVFPDAALVMWVEPVGATTTRVERRLLLASDRPPDVSQAIIESHRLVHQQDVDICTRVQRSHSAGLDADGVLATTEERGVFFVHEHLRRALAGGAGAA
jgi:phenylpropionate dioxygenase-like ring-hydroxylating dioxygenase large terminal subunit